MEFIVDFQAFKDLTNRFIIKELTILSENGCLSKTFMFKPPIPFNRLPQKLQKQTRWLEQFYHGIRWSSGDTSYGDIVKIFSDLILKGDIFVTDIKKKQCLEEILLPFFEDIKIFNLQDFGCPGLKFLKRRQLNRQMYGKCPFPHKSVNCSTLNACLLLQWWREKKVAS